MAGKYHLNFLKAEAPLSSPSRAVTGPMYKNGTYHENYLFELYKLIFISFKTEIPTWISFS
ncbi:hypothetical protein I4U23_005479 [Adineta vaga]|nr:hypothetical protein I4U23_005479 [Adineta vaga]